MIPLSEKKIFKIDNESAGYRLDIFVSHMYPNVSRVKIQRSINEGLILLNDEKVKKKTLLKSGDVIEVDKESMTVQYEISLEPQELDLEILYEDDHIIIVNKPAGLVVHPGIGNRDGTLVNALLFYCKSLSSGSAEDRPGIVHRLDKNTSGAIVVAKNDEAHNALVELFTERKVIKKYTAFCIGKHPHKEDTINAPIGRKINDPLRFCVTNIGKEAITDYSLITHNSGISILDLQLHTGRTHQIRVHCSHSGFPIVEDFLYGGDKSKVKILQPLDRPFAHKIFKCFSRQALHAREISFAHPFTKEQITIRAPFPEDFKKAIKVFGEVQGDILDKL
jgi:23S rRNA pseudouridine1911/1915/1917 synthase